MFPSHFYHITFLIPSLHCNMSSDLTPPFRAPQIVCSVRQALFSPAETLPVEQCVGRVCALPPAACPPCVPIVLSGERIDGQAAQMLLSYGVTECSVMRETHGE